MSRKYGRRKWVERGGSHPSNVLTEGNKYEPGGRVGGKHDQANKILFSHLNK